MRGKFRGVEMPKKETQGAVTILASDMFRPVRYRLDICGFLQATPQAVRSLPNLLKLKRKSSLIYFVIQYETAAIARISTVYATRHNALTKIW
jgi:hypothetical protein